MKTYTIFDKKSGAIVGLRQSNKSIDSIPLLDGQGILEGVSDALSQRVEEGYLVDYQPPRPDDNHYWDTQEKRWFVNPIFAAKRARETEILQMIKGIDERLIRPLVEIQVNPDDAVAIKIRDTLVAEKNTLRSELAALRETL